MVSSSPVDAATHGETRTPPVSVTAASADNSPLALVMAVVCCAVVSRPPAARESVWVGGYTRPRLARPRAIAVDQDQTTESWGGRNAEEPVPCGLVV